MSRENIRMVNNEIYIENEYYKKENIISINAIIHIRDKNEEYKKVIDALQVVELMFKDKIEIIIKLKKTKEKNLFVSFHNQTIFKDCDKLDSYIYIVKNILNKKTKKEKAMLNMYKEKDFFDLPKDEQEAIKNALNNIVYEYELDEVCEIILFQFLKQFYAEQYSELDYTFLVNKIVLSSSSIKKNLMTLIKKGILKYKTDTVYELSEEILKPFDDIAFQKQFCERKEIEKEWNEMVERGCEEILEETGDIQIIDMNTNKEVSVDECVNLMIKNSAINK